MVVDDEPNIVLSLKFLMEKAGFEVVVATDGEEALNLALEHKPDLVLLDVMVPKRDGYDVCQTLRATAGLSNVKIVMLTAKGRMIEKEKAWRLGPTSISPNPSTPGN